MPFPRHTIDTAPAESQPALAAIQRKFGAIPPAAAAQATSPRLLNGFLEANKSFEESSLPEVAREVVTLCVAARNECHTCIAIHSRVLTRLGHPDFARRILENSPLPGPQLESVRVFTIQLLDHTGAVTDEELRAFLDAGHTLEQALEVVFGIGVYTMSTFANRLVRA
ncbi:carboxymuconolactone decarboxylase family protein [Tessaracoccus caeni]|uniref:carboxymuconolactone decarboxylase family protein n=1 Tax=Tessaracoccus caeni TaxID=3031239 RepID=UPI0023D9E04F|nr:carboxymuconolactone decarboxylase family protein [Tessaracoccus caeni]MDF1488679.1 carboxymuconolactone decarboxylase family protein [Tessaracoccus caeni]